MSKSNPGFSSLVNEESSENEDDEIKKEKRRINKNEINKEESVARQLYQTQILYLLV